MKSARRQQSGAPKIPWQRRKSPSLPTVDRLNSIFRFDFERGKIWWVNPPLRMDRLRGREAGCVRPEHTGKAYWMVRVDGWFLKRARVIFFVAAGRWPTPCVDHINGDSLDDRLRNLREATLQQNNRNRKHRPKPSGLPMGVARARWNNRFQARINSDGRRLYLGTFDTVELAESAYKRKRIELFGEWA